MRGLVRSGAAVVKLHGRCVTSKETFCATKDPRYGLGLSATHMRDVHRRDRLLKVKTAKTRTHSL